MRHKGEQGINIKLSSVTRNCLASSSDYLDYFHFADCRDLISGTVILWAFLKILLLDPTQPNPWMDPTLHD